MQKETTEVPSKVYAKGIETMIAFKLAWHQAIFERRSRRQFTAEPISKDIINSLNGFSSELNGSFDGVKIILIMEKAEEIFRGAVGSYGKIKGAPAYAAFIGDNRDINVQEKIGYAGESLILEATTLGLSTCWVGGFFRPEIVARQINILDSESVLAVSPLGYVKEKYSFEEKMMSKMVASHKRKDINELCDGLPQEKWPGWVEAALEAARLAPSAVNRQPWRFTVDKNAIKVSVDNLKHSHNISKRLDCGISMLHLEVGAFSKGVAGEWEYLTDPEVAVFRVADGEWEL